MKCRLCGNDNLKLYYTQGHENQFKYYKCPNCQLVNYDIAGGLNQMKYTEEVYIHPREESHKQNINQTATFNFIQKNVPQKGKILDIGCGNGKILVLAKDNGWQANGLELSESLARSINENFGIDVTVANFLEYKPDDSEKYDLVVLRHVLEHLPDSISAMKKINNLLKPGGYCVMEFPDIESYEMKLKRFMEKTGIHKKKYRKDYVPGHSNEFSKPAFEYLLDRTGFTLLKWENYSSKDILNAIYKFIPFGAKARVLIKKKGDK